MPYRYRCAACHTNSRPYPTNHQAQRHGHQHRHDRHNGDHPDGETIQHTGFEQRQPGEVFAGILVATLILISLVLKYG